MVNGLKTETHVAAYFNTGKACAVVISFVSMFRTTLFYPHWWAASTFPKTDKLIVLFDSTFISILPMPTSLISLTKAIRESGTTNGRFSRVRGVA